MQTSCTRPSRRGESGRVRISRKEGEKEKRKTFTVCLGGVADEALKGELFKEERKLGGGIYGQAPLGTVRSSAPKKGAPF